MNVPQCYIDNIKNMYEEIVTSIRSIGGTSNEFSVIIGLTKDHP